MSDSTVPENPTRFTIARWLFVFSLGLNFAVVVQDLLRGQVRAGALQSMALAGCAAALWLLPKIERWMDARFAAASAQLRISELALQQLQTQINANAVGVRVTAETPRRWPEASRN